MSAQNLLLSEQPEAIDAHLITTAARPDIVFVRGEGSWLFDRTGRRYVDLVQGWAVNSLGHSPVVISDVLASQAQRLICASPAFYNQPMLDLAHSLAQATGLERVFLASTGAEANEGAIKLARRWGQRHRNGAHEVICFSDAFHGRTLAMMSASGKPGWDRIFAPMPTGFVRAAFNDLASVERVIGERTAAIIVEPVQGEAGVRVADRSFLQGLRTLSEQHGVLLIFDEVQTGIGRCGAVVAAHHFGVMPDIMTLAKGLGGGVPLSALLCRDWLNVFEPGDQGGTYTGNPLMSAVGLAVVNTVFQPAFLAQVQERTEQLSQGLQSISQSFGCRGERGLGLLRALALPTDSAASIVVAARSLQPTGLLLNAPRPNLLRFMPALTISPQDLELALYLLRRALAQVLVR